MPLSYKITAVDTVKKVAILVVTFENGDTYNKRMMVDVSSEESIKRGIEKWLEEYIKAKSQEVVYDPTPILNKSVTEDKFQRNKHKEVVSEDPQVIREV